jgi:hypothetical protein
MCRNGRNACEGFDPDGRHGRNRGPESLPDHYFTEQLPHHGVGLAAQAVAVEVLVHARSNLPD